MDRKTFLRTVCGLGVCGCAAHVAGSVDLEAAPQTDAPQQRLAFARYQIANLARHLADSQEPACVAAIEQTGGDCAKLGGLAARFRGNPEGYFAEARKAWGTDFQWDKAANVITVTVAEGPCGCPMVDQRRTPAFWCDCSVGYQKESFTTLFGRPVQASLKASKLSGATRCVFEVVLPPA